MKKTVTIRERIAVWANFMWLKHYQAGVECFLSGNDVGYWRAAERIELKPASTRAASAAKAAATPRANAAAKVTAEMLIAAKGRPASRRPTAR